MMVHDYEVSGNPFRTLSLEPRQARMAMHMPIRHNPWQAGRQTRNGLPHSQLTRLNGFQFSTKHLVTIKQESADKRPASQQ